MKLYSLIISLLIAASCKAQELKLDYSEFGITFYPTNCVDTLKFLIDKGQFKNLTAKIFLEDCKGKCKFIVTDKKNNTRITGFYSSAFDTLVKYNNAKEMGKPYGHSYYKVRILNYLSPLRVGIWIYYNKYGKKIYATEYHFERDK